MKTSQVRMIIQIIFNSVKGFENWLKLEVNSNLPFQSYLLHVYFDFCKVAGSRSMALKSANIDTSDTTM